MPLVGIARMLHQARRAGYAVPGFCIWNAETIHTVLHTAAQEKAPVILMSGPGEFPLLPPAVLGTIARPAAESLDIPVAIHLDHGNSLAMVAECLDAGFTSVMLDASHLPFEENVALTRKAVEMARARGCDSEGEIGAVGRVDDTSIEAPHAGTLTDPEEAVRFAAQPGVAALAVSIGNAHGIYPGLPKLDFERLGQISAQVEVPLVLHGGSGTPPEDVQRAIGLGIAKVNVASELGRAFATDLEHRLSDPSDTLWVPLQMAEALHAIGEVVVRWLRATGASGQANG